MNSSVSVYRRSNPYDSQFGMSRSNDEASSKEDDDLRYLRHLQRRQNEEDTPGRPVFYQSGSIIVESESATEAIIIGIVSWILHLILSCAVRYSL